MAASACINNTIGFSPDNFLDYPLPHKDNLSDLPDPDLPLADFEFSLQDPAIMLPADQLFSDGKLIPLHQPTTTTPSKPRRRVSVADPFLYSPKAPKCSSRWKQLLGFRKLYQNNNGIAKPDDNNGNKSIKQFLQLGSKSPNDSLPLLKDTDNNEPTSRLSLSSSSSSHDPDELPRVSLDSEKPAAGKMNSNNPPRTRMVKIRTASSSDGRRCPTEGSVRIESPRMNSSGKIVFQSLERSSSSPSSLNGLKHRGMERSYSGNVRVSRVLNVPVCSVRKSGGVFGLPLFSSPQNQKREALAGSGSGSNGGGSRK